MACLKVTDFNTEAQVRSGLVCFLARYFILISFNLCIKGLIKMGTWHMAPSYVNKRALAAIMQLFLYAPYRTDDY